MMKLERGIITNPFTPIPVNQASHTRGYAMIWAELLGKSMIASKSMNLRNYGHVYIDHGVNFSGSLNLFGGLTNDVYERLSDLMAHPSVYSLDWDMEAIDYPSQLRKRLEVATTSKRFTSEFIDKFEQFCKTVKTIKMSDLNLSKAIIGDSHSLAFAPKMAEVYRTNGLTLYSVLYQQTLKKLIEDTLGIENLTNGRYRNIDICLGSIDIRFHVLNNGNPSRITATELAKEYANQIIATKLAYNICIRPCFPVPIEYEERKIPSNGKYKGKNFNGSRDERIEANKDFCQVLDDNFLEFDSISPPTDWYFMDGEKYAKNIMEMTSSVHIAPKNYRSILGWGE